MAETFLGVCVCGLLCLAASTAIDGDTTFGIVVPINLRPMSAMSVLLGDVVIALAFAMAAAAALTQHHSLTQRDLGLMKLCEY
jgi:hypothetical protein